MKKVIALFILSLFSLMALAQRTEGTANAHLSGRNVVGTLPRPTYNAQLGGTVVVRIKVDQYGNVTEAVPGVEGTTVTDSGLWNVARNAAMKAHFNTKADAPVVQTGTIIYEFKAQDSPILKFLGIPIDGPEEQFITQLEAKGFRYDTWHKCYKGQFNGKHVDVYVVNNHGTVYRVFVAFPKTNEFEIRSEFNHLLSQFLRNVKYIPTEKYKDIDQNEDVSYEMTVHKKQYSASFAYLSPDIFTSEQAIIIRELVDKYKTLSDEEREQYIESLDASLFPNSDNSSQDDLMVTMNRLTSILSGNVWFRIIRDGIDYQIGLYYDNIKNMPNGEDL